MVSGAHELLAHALLIVFVVRFWFSHFLPCPHPRKERYRVLLRSHEPVSAVQPRSHEPVDSLVIDIRHGTCLISMV